MPEYIDREALITEINEEIEHRTPMYTDEQNDYIEKGLRIARKDIKRFSATDVVEVVRCKDCEYAKEYKNNLFCCYYPRAPKSVSSNDYCSYGIRKDGNK